jgi:hypothetical protein
MDTRCLEQTTKFLRALAGTSGDRDEIQRECIRIARFLDECQGDDSPPPDVDLGKLFAELVDAEEIACELARDLYTVFTAFVAANKILTKQAESAREELQKALVDIAWRNRNKRQRGRCCRALRDAEADAESAWETVAHNVDKPPPDIIGITIAASRQLAEKEQAIAERAKKIDELRRELDTAMAASVDLSALNKTERTEAERVSEDLRPTAEELRKEIDGLKGVHKSDCSQSNEKIRVIEKENMEPKESLMIEDYSLRNASSIAPRFSPCRQR